MVSKDNPVAQIEITNTVKDKKPEPTITPEPSKVPTETPTPTVSPEPTETPVPTETPMPTATITETPGNSDGGNTPGGSTGTSNVKTGDDTQTEPFVLLILISGCALVFVSRKKRKSA